MDENIDKLSSTGVTKEAKSPNCNEKKNSNGKSVNSWDCSSLTPHGQISKEKTNDWDLSSDCQETLVEPFVGKFKPCDNWDFDNDKPNLKKINLERNAEIQFYESSSNSIDLSARDLSDIDKNSSSDGFNFTNVEKSIYPSERSFPIGENDLMIEDLEEFIRDENSKSQKTKKEQTSRSTQSEKVRSNNREGTAEDTTIWMVSKSERSESTDFTSNLNISPNGKKVAEFCNLETFVKKAKSFSDMRMFKNINKKHSRDPCLSDMGSLENYKLSNNFFLNCEGSSLQRKFRTKTEMSKEGKTGCENFDRTGVFFTEYECRTVTMNKDVPEKMSLTSRTPVSSTEEGLSETTNEIPVVATDLDNSNNRANRNSEAPLREFSLAGPSVGTSLDVVSLPDIPLKNQKFFRRASGQGKNENSDSKTIPPNTTKQVNESWILLDETGQCQAVTKSEVKFLLNGRSADAVLQGRKEHVIPSATLKDTTSLRGSISSLLTKESLQYFLREEDTGGEDNKKRLIDLERKMENTLLYIQPNMNLTASIRIIPVDTEMVHVWRRTRDSGSLLSSDVDLRLNFSQDSVENNLSRHSSRQPSFSPRMIIERSQQAVAEMDETLNQEILSSPPVNTKETEMKPNQTLDSIMVDHSTLLIETRMIVDNLSNNFKQLQNRLDGETSRNIQLQNEVNKLRHLLKNFGGKTFLEKNSKELMSDHSTSNFNGTSSFSLLPVKLIEERTEIKNDKIFEEPCKAEVITGTSIEILPSEVMKSSEIDKQTENDSLTGSGFITVNIYTMEASTSNNKNMKIQETNSLLQTNLGIIEGKMKRLQEENEVITKQNFDLKRKLKDISLELEKYLSSTSVGELCNEEDKEMEPLRDQVCNLKLELDNLTKMARNKEKELSAENCAIKEKLSQEISVQEKWRAAAADIFQNFEVLKRNLNDIGFEIITNLDMSRVRETEYFRITVASYVQEMFDFLQLTHNDNLLYDQALRETLQSSQKKSCSFQETVCLNHDISGYSNLTEQHHIGSGDTEVTVIEDYFSLIVEKDSLIQEMKILKTENELLLESQREHHEKLKQTMIALKDKKSEIEELESSQKLLSDEKNKILNLIEFQEEEKNKVKDELCSKNTIIENLTLELGSRDLEIKQLSDQLNTSTNELINFEKSSIFKDELINDFRIKIDDLFRAQEIKNNQLECMRNELQNLEVEKVQLESELASTKVLLNESHKEMAVYVSHLETLINTTQENLDKTKQELKKSNHTISRLEKEVQILDEQHQCDLKLHDKTKDELESYKENILSLEKNFKEVDEEKEMWRQKYEVLNRVEKEKSEAFELTKNDYKLLFKENSDLKEKISLLAKDKDESLKEQKDLINKYAILSKEIQKLQEKYKNIKIECNERTKLIKFLEIMLKENLLEYNNRTACLEKNISHIIEKIAACKICMKEKHLGVDIEARELRHQLNVTYQERKELEYIVKNYSTLMKHLEGEILEREKIMKELHRKLSLEQQKVSDFETEKNSTKNFQKFPDHQSEYLEIEELKAQITLKDNELLDCKKQLHNSQDHFNCEKKKMELIIVDLKSEINRYKMKINIMLKNLSNSKKSTNGLITEKSTEELSKTLMKKQIEEKDREINKLKEVLNNYKLEINKKDCDLENLKNKEFHLDEELKNVKNQLLKMEDALLITRGSNETQQKEKDEIAEKLLQSIKLIMEERSARQTIECLSVGKEKNFKEQIDRLKNEMVSKIKECETLSRTLEDKKELVYKLQDRLTKMKTENTLLKKEIQKVNNYNNFSLKKNCDFNECYSCQSSSSKNKPNSLSNLRQRLESCLKELKEVRDINLLLRKTEGQHQTKIILLENEIRDARLLIKELQGDIKTERKSKRAFKNMIVEAKAEIQKCLATKQLNSSTAEKITRHLDLPEVQSRELLSDLRLSNSSDSPQIKSGNDISII